MIRRTMKPPRLSLFAAGVVCFTFIPSMRAQQSLAERVAGVACATARGAGRGSKGIEAPHCHAVFAHERHPLHLTRGCWNDRARPLVRSRTDHERGTSATIRGRIFPGPAPDACGSFR